MGEMRDEGAGQKFRASAPMHATLADAGLPMIFVELPAMLLALLPVIMVEAWIAKVMLKLPFARVVPASAAANAATTILGFPLLWILLFGIQLACGGGGWHNPALFWNRVYSVTVQAPWLVPPEHPPWWMIPAAAIYLLVPAFFVSVFVERWICGLFWKETPRPELRRYSWIAHLSSYVLLIGFSLFYVEGMLHAIARAFGPHR